MTLSSPLQGGLYVFQLFDYYACSGMTLLVFAIFQSVCVGWVYGMDIIMTLLLVAPENTMNHPDRHWWNRKRQTVLRERWNRVNDVWRFASFLKAVAVLIPLYVFLHVHYFWQFYFLCKITFWTVCQTTGFIFSVIILSFRQIPTLTQSFLVIQVVIVCTIT